MNRIIAFIIAAALLLAAPMAQAAGFVDDSGRKVSFERPFKRIISLYAAHTENLYALGLDKEILAVSTIENYPPQALKKPAYSYRDDPERFIALRPDLVLIRPMIWRGYRSLVDRLERAGITVVSLQPRGVDDMFDYWNRLGMLTGREERARAMIAEFQTGVDAFKARLAGIPPQKRPGVYFESIHKKMKTFAPGAMALFVLDVAGGRNLAPEAEPSQGTVIADFGKERILAKAAQIEVFLAQYGTMNKVNLTEIRNESGFSIIKAVKEGRVHLVPEEIVSRPTLRLLEGIRLIHGLLYPDRR